MPDLLSRNTTVRQNQESLLEAADSTGISESSCNAAVENPKAKMVPSSQVAPKPLKEHVGQERKSRSAELCWIFRGAYAMEPR